MVPLSSRIRLPPSKRTKLADEDVVVKVPLAGVGGEASAPVTPTAAPRIATTQARAESLERRTENATANIFRMCSSQSPTYGREGQTPSLHQSPWRRRGDSWFAPQRGSNARRVSHRS